MSLQPVGIANTLSIVTEQQPAFIGPHHLPKILELEAETTH